MPRSLPWFRAYTDMLGDDKLGLLAFEDRWHFIALLCCKGAGLLDKGDAPTLLRRKVALKLGLATRELDEVARRLAEVSLIEYETLQPIAWEERQFKSDNSTERVRAYRERTKQGCNVSATAQDTDTDTEVKQKPAQPTASRFDDFWTVYPHKRGKKPSRAKWAAKKLDAKADEIIADVKRRKTSDERWLRDVIPDPLTYLNQERWEDELSRSSTVSRSPSKPAEPAETKLEAAVAHARHMHRVGAWDADKMQSEIARVTELHRGEARA